MSEFMEQAKKLASEHQDVADEAFDKAAELAKDKTGGRFGNQIDEGERRAEGFLGVEDQDTQGGNQ
jgi:uncharacterized protein with gpF-like domain